MLWLFYCLEEWEKEKILLFRQLQNEMVEQPSRTCRQKSRVCFRLPQLWKTIYSLFDMRNSHRQILIKFADVRVLTYRGAEG